MDRPKTILNSTVETFGAKVIQQLAYAAFQNNSTGQYARGIYISELNLEMSFSDLDRVQTYMAQWKIDQIEDLLYDLLRRPGIFIYKVDSTHLLDLLNTIADVQANTWAYVACPILWPKLYKFIMIRKNSHGLKLKIQVVFSHVELRKHITFLATPLEVVETHAVSA